MTSVQMKTLRIALSVHPVCSHFLYILFQHVPEHVTVEYFMNIHKIHTAVIECITCITQSKEGSGDF